MAITEEQKEINEAKRIFKSYYWYRCRRNTLEYKLDEALENSKGHPHYNRIVKAKHFCDDVETAVNKISSYEGGNLRQISKENAQAVIKDRFINCLPNKTPREYQERSGFKSSQYRRLIRHGLLIFNRLYTGIRPDEFEVKGWQE